MNNFKKILIIDDEEDICHALRVQLISQGFDVLIANDGKDGIQKARESKPNLILLDLVMPGMNGFQVCHDLKHDPMTENIPIIMLTAKAQEDDRSWGKEVGADDYVTKPFHVETLIQRIKENIQ